MSSITTYTGYSIDPFCAERDAIRERDIAHALSLLCRANGHFPYFYSVGQHCLNCAAEAAARGCSRRVQLACLLHDASEAYMADIPRPVKAHLTGYREAEARLLEVIYGKWLSPSLTEEERAQVLAVDNVLLYHEFLNVMGRRLPEEEPTLYAALSFEQEDFGTVESRYLRALHRLTGEDTPAVGVGVDWSKDGWLVAKLQDGFATWETLPSVADVCKRYAASSAVLIDIPIGLPSSAAELDARPDGAMRRYLKAHKSSVFTTPLRQVVYADSKARMWQLNEELGGKLTPPGSAILPCIRQVDTFLRENPSWRHRLLESHPECAFQALNGNRGLAYSKHTAEGREERTAILSPYVDNVRELVEKAKPSQREDVLDALCLAVTAVVGYRSLTASAVDSEGIPMQVVIADIS